MCAIIFIIFGSRIGDVDIMKGLTAKLGSSSIVERSSLLSAATEPFLSKGAILTWADGGG